MKKFAIIDLETTGGTASRERITEIAIAIHNGVEVLDTFSSLVNPERSIPYNITQITGITDAMVKDAPKFYEIAKKVVEMTEDCVFVAHNVRFDYSFLQEEFKRLGFTYSRKQLCTVKMARQSMPGLRSYSLGNLITHLGIKVENRHRALDDTLATVKLFEKIIAIENGTSTMEERVNLGIKEANLPEGISIARLHELPESCGVYYLHDAAGDVIYVGKSINIRKRIFEHFADKTEKGKKMYNGVADISYEVTGSELISLLLENHEIKRIKPRINKAQKARNFPYVIYQYKDESGYISFGTAKNTHHIRNKMAIVAEYQQLNYAKGALSFITKEFELCGKHTGTDAGEGPCFPYHLSRCKGACVNEESFEIYNIRAMQAIENLQIIFHDNFMLIDQGKSAEEKAVIHVEDNQFVGFGYFSAEETINDPQIMKGFVKKFPQYPETLRIIRMFLDEKKGLKKIVL
ncbi:MAG: exonuclease domain-containing protein [Saprospiraceae bacterium]